ncbi:MAG: AraC family transcriptional regulator [Flammeovirgaceae bacterium]|nr:AraC family transcriptional regulator [Flammeovirgaceae bacterium]MBE61421.1 AraC family transcriptional regulator [Flammeovirgaceae bacterium]
MMHTYKESLTGAFFGLSTDYIHDYPYFDQYKGLIHIHWNRCKDPIHLKVDGVGVELLPGQMTTTTYLNRLVFESDTTHLTSFGFNREFYCIIDHDHEVSCNGILFFGNQKPPIITPNDRERQRFDLEFEVLKEEYQTRDRVQGEMLRTLLKRLIIRATRLAKEQLWPEGIHDEQTDLIRQYKVLVDTHFRDKHQVAEYAEMLYKSPKTLTNVFKKYDQPSPLQIIQDRIALEAKRLLMYSDKTTKEIAHEVGFSDVSSFHRSFKKVTKLTPQEFKKSHELELV